MRLSLASVGARAQELPINEELVATAILHGGDSALAADLGAAVALGDVNGDGHDDILISAPGARSGLGEVHLIFGGGSEECPATAGANLILPLDGDARFIGSEHEGQGEALGQAIALMDLDGDGMDDIILGAPNHSSAEGGLLHGAVHIWLSSRTGGGFVLDPVPTATASLTLLGEAQGQGELGSFLGPAPDLDLDGAPELLVGAPDYTPGSDAPSAGRLYVLSGEGLLLAAQRAEAPAAVGAHARWILQGESRYASLGVTGVALDLGDEGILLGAGSPGNRQDSHHYPKCEGGIVPLYRLDRGPVDSALIPTPEAPPDGVLCSLTRNAGLGLALAPSRSDTGERRLYIGSPNGANGDGLLYAVDPLAATAIPGAVHTLEDLEDVPLLFTLKSPGIECKKSTLSESFGSRALVLAPGDITLPSADGCLGGDAVADLDGDGWPDPVVAAPHRCAVDAGEIESAGWVGILGTEGDSVSAIPNLAFSLPLSGQLGQALAQGDVNGDGNIDLLIGAPGQPGAYLIPLRPYVDADGDGFRPYPVGEDAEAEGSGDCDDQDPEIHPGAEESCGAPNGEGDGVDEDCDGMVDEGDLTFYRDADGDGFGDPNSALQRCGGAPGLVDNARDCDDEDPDRSPRAEERCDGQDNDCDGLADDADSDSPPVDATLWYVDRDGDCHGDEDDPGRSACAQPAPPPGLDFDLPEVACEGAPDKFRPYVNGNGDCNDEPGVGVEFHPDIVVEPNNEYPDLNCDGRVGVGCGFRDETVPRRDEGRLLSCTTSRSAHAAMALILLFRIRRRSPRRRDSAPGGPGSG